MPGATHMNTIEKTNSRANTNTGTYTNKYTYTYKFYGDMLCGGPLN